jgi:hypothetical protein
VFAISCSSNDDAIDVPPPAGSTTVELSGNLETQTLVASKKYLITGQVFVRDGKTLTVEPGTIIMGDKATKGTLIIDRGGKINANGTALKPIVFTSALAVGTRDRGDWGGLVILGKAIVNVPDPSIEGITPAVVYGGTVDNDNSGTLNYVRVEFAGIELTPNNETNSITLGGVGSGTIMTNCQVSFGGDDGYEWFGGSVNGKNLISYGSWDDSFDIDFGYTGKLQFLLDVRYASYADQSGSNGIECDTNANDAVPAQGTLTTGVISNYTSIGPRATAAQSINANFQHAVDLRRRTALSIGNSVMIGYPRGIRFNQQSVYENYAPLTGTPVGFLINNVLVADLLPYNVGSGGTTNTVAALTTLWTVANTTITANDFAANYATLGLNTAIAFGTNINTAYPTNPNFAVTTGLLATGAAFTNAKFSTGFEVVTYRGAFGATDWTDTWAEFNPIGKAY